MVARKEYNSEGMKHCFKCGEWKDPLEGFTFSKREWDTRSKQCRECSKAYFYANRDRENKRRRENHRLAVERDPEGFKRRKSDYYQLNRERFRELSLLRQYGITVAEYDEMLTAQKGVCGICEEICSRKERLSVDHCHKTGVTRGLLCSDCNTAIGLLKENPIIIDAALMYIVTHRMRIQDNVG